MIGQELQQLYKMNKKNIFIFVHVLRAFYFFFYFFYVYYFLFVFYLSGVVFLMAFGFQWRLGTLSEQGSAL